MATEKYQISALEKLANSNLLRKVYPMVDGIEVLHDKSDKQRGRLVAIIHLKDPEINSDNMYEKGFDPDYLVSIHFVNFMKYLGIDRMPVGFQVYGPEGNLITQTL